eukprot:10950430-Prorocentrum_lima.AAC.1
MGAKCFISDSSAGGPKIEDVRRRLTLDLHTREILGDMEIDGSTHKGVLGGKIPNAPRDILTYWFHQSVKPTTNDTSDGRMSQDDYGQEEGSWASLQGDDILSLIHISEPTRLD